MMEPWSESIQFRTLKSRFEDLGHPSRKKKWLFPRRNPPIKYRDLTKANGRTLFQFYVDRGGSYEAFNLFCPNSDTYSGEYVGTGNGSTLIFNLPSKLATSYTLYVDNVAKTGGGVDYTFSSEGGADGADKVTFAAAPADGARITFNFTGYLKIHGCFAEDNLDFETFYNRLVNMGMKINGELNE
jgi:hypothetical protein